MFLPVAPHICGNPYSPGRYAGRSENGQRCVRSDEVACSDAGPGQVGEMLAPAPVARISNRNRLHRLFADHAAISRRFELELILTYEVFLSQGRAWAYLLRRHRRLCNANVTCSR